MSISEQILSDAVLHDNITWNCALSKTRKYDSVRRQHRSRILRILDEGRYVG